MWHTYILLSMLLFVYNHGRTRKSIPLLFKIDFEVELQRLLKGLQDQTLSGRVVTPPKILNRK